MNTSTAKADYIQFLADMLKAKFQQAFNDEEILQRLLHLVNSNNPYANEAIRRARLQYGPGDVQGSVFWEKFEQQSMTDIAKAPPRNATKRDELGLWDSEQVSKD